MSDPLRKLTAEKLASAASDMQTVRGTLADMRFRLWEISRTLPSGYWSSFEAAQGGLTCVIQALHWEHEQIQTAAKMLASEPEPPK